MISLGRYSIVWIIKRLQYLKLGILKFFNNIFYYRENTYLAVGTEDGEIYIWNTSSNTVQKKFSPHKGSIKSISYSPDGQKLSTCGLDSMIQITDVNTGMSLYSKMMPSPLLCLKWEDYLLFAGSECGILYVWNIIEVRLILEKQINEGNIYILHFKLVLCSFFHSIFET